MNPIEFAKFMASCLFWRKVEKVIKDHDKKKAAKKKKAKWLRKKHRLYYEVIRMKNLIFKESFDWDKRFINDEKPTKHGKEFYEGIIIGVGVCVITGMILSIVDAL